MRNRGRSEFVSRLGADRESVFESLRRGFVRVLLRHAMHAYVCCVSDHVQVMHQLGSFRSVSGLFSGAPRRAIDEAREPGTGALLKDVLMGEVRSMHETLQRVMGVALKDLEMEEKYPLVMRGVREAVVLVGHSANHARLPSLTSEFVRRMLAKKVITDADKREAVNASEVSMSDVLHHMGPEHMGQLLGAAAVVYAHMCPLFTNCVITRCASGLLQSTSATSYNTEYVRAMRDEIYESFANEESVAAQREILQGRRAELQLQLDDFQGSLVALRQIERER